MNLRELLRAFASIAAREAERIRHDTDILLIILVAPLFYAFFYGAVYVEKGEQDVPVVIVDGDRTPLSRELARRIDAHQLVRVAGETGDLHAGERVIETGEAEGVVVIPEGFAKGVATGRGGDVTLELNTTRFLVSNDMNRGITEACRSLSGAKGGGPLRVEVLPMFNTTESYGDFLIPGILVVILQQTMWIGLAESLGKEREAGTLSGVKLQAGGRGWLVIAGKLSVYVTIFAAFSLFLYTVHFSLFAIPFRGSPLLFAGVLLLFLCAAGSVGFFVATFFPKKILALQILGFTSYPIFLMTGYSWPSIAMPECLRVVAMAFPMTPFLGASTRILEMGAGPAEVAREAVHLVVLIVLGWGLSVWRISRVR